MRLSKLERLFRLAAQLDIDKTDLQRCIDFVNQKLCDLLLRGEGAATANGRDVIHPHACAFTIIEPGLKNPQTRHWEQAMGVFNLLL